MADGYGFGGEGDWKTAALRAHAEGHGARAARRHVLHGGLHLPPRRPASRGSSARTCSRSARRSPPSRPRCEIHPLGDRRPGGPGPAGVRRRARARRRRRPRPTSATASGSIANEVDVVEPDEPLPRLPVARAVWKPRPTSRRRPRAGCSPAARTTPCSRTARRTSRRSSDFAEMAGVELLVIDENTTTEQFAKELRWNEAYYRLAQGL